MKVVGEAIGPIGTVVTGRFPGTVSAMRSPVNSVTATGARISPATKVARQGQSGRRPGSAPVSLQAHQA